MRRSATPTPPTAAPVVSVRRAKARGAVLAAMAAEGRLEERLADLMLALRECFGCEHAVCVLRRGGGLALAAVDERPYDLGAASGDGAGFFGAEVVRSGAALRVDDAANDDPRFNAAFGAERLPGVDVRAAAAQQPEEGLSRARARIVGVEHDLVLDLLRRGAGAAHGGCPNGTTL